MNKKPYLIIRDDGFSQFYSPDNPYHIEKDDFLSQNVDYMTHYPTIRVKEYGVGPGSVFTYPTKIGDVLDERRVTETTLDPWRCETARRVRDLVDRGEDPMAWVSERCHELGIEMWVRFELNHEYAPPTERNWAYAFLTGSFNKNHPEYRIPGKRINLDFRHPEVRAFKVEILRECVRHNIEGVSLDFCVYPPFVENPAEDHIYLTQFVREVRAMLDEEEKALGHPVKIIVRMPYDGENIGVHWREWVDAGLVQALIPSVVRIADRQDIDFTPFVEYCCGKNCDVICCVRPFFGTVSTDLIPGEPFDRQNRPVTPRIYCAKALLALRQGADGLQIALATGGLRDTRPLKPGTDLRRDGFEHIHGKLADPVFVEHADKEYVLAEADGLPAYLTAENPSVTLPFRIADKLDTVARAEVRFRCRGLAEDESLTVCINGQPPVKIVGSPDAEPLVPVRHGKRTPAPELFTVHEWWETGAQYPEIPLSFLKYWENEISFRYTGSGELMLSDVSIRLNIV